MDASSLANTVTELRYQLTACFEVEYGIGIGLFQSHSREGDQSQ
jgi:hypothetical protein